MKSTKSKIFEKKSGFSVKGKRKQFCQRNCKYEHSNSSEATTRTREQGDLFKVVQAKKSIRRMPWHWEPTKDVTSCDKLR